MRVAPVEPVRSHYFPSPFLRRLSIVVGAEKRRSYIIAIDVTTEGTDAFRNASRSVVVHSSCVLVLLS